MKYLNIIITTITAIALNACCKPAPCKKFTADELAWIPYKDGDVITFKSNLTSQLISFTAQKKNDTPYSNNTCTEGQNYCDSRLIMSTYGPSDTLDMGMSIENENNFNKNNFKSYKFWVIIGGVRIYDSSENNSYLQTISINGTIYSNTSLIKGTNVYDTIYYGKNIGFIAFHKIKTKEWFYKQ